MVLAASLTHDVVDNDDDEEDEDGSASLLIRCKEIGKNSKRRQRDFSIHLFTCRPLPFDSIILNKLTR